MLPMLMIPPPPCSFMIFIASRIPRKTPVRFTAITRSQPLEGHLRQRDVVSRARVVDRDVDAAELADRALEQRLDLPFDSDVGLYHYDISALASQVIGGEVQGLAIPGAYDQRRALARECPSDSTAYSRARPGDYREFSVKLAHCHPPMRPYRLLARWLPV